MDFFLKAISLGSVVVPSPKIIINLPRTYISYSLKKNHTGSVVSEILQYTQTEFLLLYYKDDYFYFLELLRFI